MDDLASGSGGDGAWEGGSRSSGPNEAALLAPLFISLLMCAAWHVMLRLEPGTLSLVPIVFMCLAPLIHIVVLQDSCDSPAAYVSSISKLSASLQSEGYVFMFVSLVLMAFVVVVDLDSVKVDRHVPDDGPQCQCRWWRSKHRWEILIDSCVRYGVLLVVLTRATHAVHRSRCTPVRRTHRTTGLAEHCACHRC